MHSYDKDFYDITRGSDTSARIIIAHVLNGLKVSSVVDFGCAAGTWLAEWKRAGVTTVLGVDGGRAAGSPLEIEESEFCQHNLTLPFESDTRFTLAQSLEVAEHLPTSAAQTFVKSLTSHADIVLFSAAPPGQGGDYHINEQPFAFWRDKFAQEGYEMFDCIRPSLQTNKDIRFWYRYNTFLFATPIAAKSLPDEWRATRVDAAAIPRDISPAWFKLRKSIVRLIPVGLQSWLSIALAKART